MLLAAAFRFPIVDLDKEGSTPIRKFCGIPFKDDEVLASDIVDYFSSALALNLELIAIREYTVYVQQWTEARLSSRPARN
jgi:hypothetical protein